MPVRVNRGAAPPQAAPSIVSAAAGYCNGAGGAGHVRFLPSLSLFFGNPYGNKEQLIAALSERRSSLRSFGACNAGEKLQATMKTFWARTLDAIDP
jgi:hypothetical protein